MFRMFLIHVTTAEENRSVAVVRLPIIKAFGGNDSSVPGADFEGVLQKTGWQRLPSGLIMQWGTVDSVSYGAGVTVTLPVPYQTACFIANATTLYERNSATNTNSGAMTEIVSTSRIQVRIGGANPYPVQWFTLGV